MPDYIRVAAIEVKLMREHLSLPHSRPQLEDCTWIANVPCGPSSEGIGRLTMACEHYGYSNVTTGNASPGATGDVCGIYVRSDVVGKSPNPLRDYLS